MLEIDGLCKSYHGRMVLEPVRFFLPEGQCLGITGDNGSGKSTLLRLLAQVEQPDGGDVRFRGRSILGDRKFLRSSVGYVPQHTDLMQDLTVERQLQLWQSACGQKQPLSEELSTLLGIEPMRKKKIRTLSGGMQRRVSIAMALMTDPLILIMDEATVGLDRDYRMGLLSWLEGYLARGGRLIWCSHDPEELDRLCGDRIRIRDGKMER